MSDLWLLLLYPFIGAICWVYVESKDPAKTRGEYIGFMIFFIWAAPIAVIAVFISFFTTNDWLNEEIK